MEEMLQQIVEAIVDAVQPDRIILFGSRLHPPVDLGRLRHPRAREGGNRRRAQHLLAAHISPGRHHRRRPDHVDQYRDAPQFLYAEALRRVLYER